MFGFAIFIGVLIAAWAAWMLIIIRDAQNCANKTLQLLVELLCAEDEPSDDGVITQEQLDGHVAHAKSSASRIDDANEKLSDVRSDLENKSQ